jgi:hypothetical protein
MKKTILILVLMSMFSTAFSQDVAGKYKGTLTIKYHEQAKPEVKPNSIVSLEKAGDMYVVKIGDMSFGYVKIKDFMLDSLETLPSTVKGTTVLERYKIADMLIPRDDGTFIPAQTMLKSCKIAGNQLILEIWTNTGLGLSLKTKFNGIKIK